MSKDDDLLYVGSGRAPIVYEPSLFPLEEGYVGVHDTPCARVVVFEHRMKRYAIASIEIVSLAGDLAPEVKRCIWEKTGVPIEHMWAVATHSVSTPHIWPSDWFRGSGNIEEKQKRANMFDAVLRAVSIAAEQAGNTMRSAVMGFEQGFCTANCNRIISTCDGLWLGSGEERVADHRVSVITFTEPDGKPIVILYHYNCQQAVMDESLLENGGRLISADLSGAASAFVENELGNDAVVMFVPGVSGDQGPAYKSKRVIRGKNGSYRNIDLHEKGYLLLELLGERLGEQVLIASEKAQCQALRGEIAMMNQTFTYKGQKEGETKSLKAEKTWDYLPADDRTSAVELFCIGDIMLVGIGVELGIRTAMEIQHESPFHHTLVVTFVSGAAVPLPNRGGKYMAEADLYDLVSFQSRNSPFAKGSAEQLRDNVLTLLNEHESAYNK